MVDYDVSYKLNDDLKKYILEKYNHVFTEVSEKQNKTRNEILIENAPFIIIDKTKCIARVWNNGFGKQCSRFKEDRGLCKIHCKQLQKKGELTLKTIYDEKPKYFNKYSI